MSAEAVIHSRRRWGVQWRPRFIGTARGRVGVVLLVLALAVAFVGPLVAPHPLDQPIGPPGAGPSGDALLGTDVLGRDVLSRVLFGGLPVLSLAVVSVALAYVLGIGIGMVAGLWRSRFEAVLMRGIDLLLVFPPLLFLLVLLAGAGSSAPVIVIGVVTIMFPGVVRIVHTATLEVSVRGYVEAAVARGERLHVIARREILPNIMPSIVADVGVRGLVGIFLISSLGFLGVGSKPPSSNWGVMIGENRVVLASNILSVVAPALMLAILAIAVNLIADAYISTRDRSGATQ